VARDALPPQRTAEEHRIAAPALFPLHAAPRTMGRMLLILVVLAVIPILGGTMLMIGKSKSIERLNTRADAEIRARLLSIAADAGGSIVDGPALETPKGRLMLVASGAPKNVAIDIAKFTAPLPGRHSLSLVPVADAAKAIRSRQMRPVTLKDPEAASTYAVFSTDEAFALAIANPELVVKLRELDRVVKIRARVQIAPNGITIVAMRGLAKPAELKAFYDECVDVVECIRAHIVA
jgi:hypothetical protein